YQEQPRKVVKRLAWAEEAYFWRMFVPRALYLSMRLLCEQTPTNDTWLLLPLTQGDTQRAESNVQKIEQLPELGEVLLGYCSDEHPFFTDIIRNPTLDLPRRPKVIPLEWPLEDNSGPVSAHLVLAARRWKKSSDSTLRSAARLLRLLQ